MSPPVTRDHPLIHTHITQPRFPALQMPWAVDESAMPGVSNGVPRTILWAADVPVSPLDIEIAHESAIPGKVSLLVITV